MNTYILIPRRARRLALTAWACLLISPMALAQQLPLTGQMMEENQAATNAVASAPDATLAPATDESAAIAAPSTDAPAHYAARIGDTTQQLLQMQVSGTHAGAPLPMLGAEASAAYQRYLKSFEHPIPEFYETTVGKNATSGR